MAQSRLSRAGDPGIGDRAGDLGAWNKLQLGWLDYEVRRGRDRREDPTTSGRRNTTANDAQALVVVLPKKNIVTELGAPFAGTNSGGPARATTWITR